MRMGQIARQIGVSREAPLLRFVTLCRPDPSHIARVDPDDLASVSPIVRPVSRNVRRCAAPVSANVRRKRPLIARPPQFDCAPLQLKAGFPPSMRRRARCPATWPASNSGFAIRATSRDSDGVTASMAKRYALAIAQKSGQVHTVLIYGLDHGRRYPRSDQSFSVCR
jgi:hypothetical protein